MKVGDKVRYKDNPDSVVCDVIEVKDLGHGKGYERVKIKLPSSFLGLTRYYAAKELVVVPEEEVKKWLSVRNAEPN